MLFMKQTRGRPKAFDEDEALVLAMNYFWEHGYDDTSLDNLLPAMGIKKSSFYHTFKSKEALFSRVLDLYRKEMLSSLEILKKQVGAKQTLIMMAQMTIQELRETGTVKGCLMVNSGQECYKKYTNLSQQIAEEFDYFYRYFTSLVKEAQANGDITNTKEASVIAGRFLNMINGLLATIQAGAPQVLIDDVFEQIKELLE